MHYLFFILIGTTMAINTVHSQELNFEKVKNFEHQLSDVMELVDTSIVKQKLVEVENDFKKEKNEINKVRLGIIYHEVALNLSFFSKTSFKGYAKKSYDILQELYNTPNTAPELMPFIAAHKASAMSLIGAETKKLKLLSVAFDEFEIAVEKYAAISYLPEFLRGSVAENLPWYFVSKHKAAKNDFESIIAKQTKNKDYANWKIMSFTYWAWANQHQKKKYRKQALIYLARAIDIDPDYRAGRKRAEELKGALK